MEQLLQVHGRVLPLLTLIFLLLPLGMVTVSPLAPRVRVVPVEGCTRLVSRVDIYMITHVELLPTVTTAPLAITSGPTDMAFVDAGMLYVLSTCASCS